MDCGRPPHVPNRLRRAGPCSKTLAVLTILLVALAASAASHPSALLAERVDGQVARTNSALTEAQEQQILAGEGMGQATAAEMTGYPGPRHVLDLGDALKLTTEQRASVQASFDRMNADVRRLGAELVQAERDLYAAFETGAATPAAIDALTTTIAGLQGTIRARHLKAHLETKGLLTGDQVAEYVRLRAHAH